MDAVMGDDDDASIEDSDDDSPIVFKKNLTSSTAGQEEKYSHAYAAADDGEDSDDLDDFSFGSGDEGSVTFKNTGKPNYGDDDGSYGRLSDDEELMFDEDDNFIPKESRVRKEVAKARVVEEAEPTRTQHDDDVDDIFAEYERRLAAADARVDSGDYGSCSPVEEKEKKKPARKEKGGGVQSRPNAGKELSVATEIKKSQFSSSLPSPLEFKSSEPVKSKTLRPHKQMPAAAQTKGGGDFSFDPKSGKIIKTKARNGRLDGGASSSVNKQRDGKFQF
jgi:hypothetical protein